MTNRRDFIKKAAIGLAAPIVTPDFLFARAKKTISKMRICYFTKHLQWLDFNDLGIVLQAAGFDGADITIRPGGHIEPTQAKSQLPLAISSLQKHGISTPMCVTNVNDPDEKGLNDLLQVLADNGIQYYRMGYLTYDYNISIEKNLVKSHETFRRLEELNAKFGLCACYQNHAGTRLGASIWDLWLSLKGMDPAHMACQFDVRHAVYEGGQSWENDFRCIEASVSTTVIKDFYWEKGDNGKWTNHNCQMGEGMVDFKKYFELYIKYSSVVLFLRIPDKCHLLKIY